VLNTEPEVTLATYTSADNDVIEVAFGDTRGRTIILAEDTGQVGAPDRIKATELTLNKNDQPDVASNMPRQLSGPEFRFVVGVLKQRAFSKRSDRLYLSKATAS
jgi:hypothetical protein